MIFVLAKFRNVSPGEQFFGCFFYIENPRSCWIENFNSTLKDRLISSILFFDIVAKIMAIWRTEMYVSYKKLWKMIIDLDMSKTELIQKSKITTNVMAHMGKNEDIRVESLVKICTALGCTFDDIAEIIPDKK